MLIEFRVANHRSLKDEQVLSMEAGPLGDEADSRPRNIPGWNKPLLTLAALYGANASGKSNVLSALAFMRDAVLTSHRLWDPEEGVPRDPFAWGDRRAEPSLFEVTFVQSGTRYEYGFVADHARFLEEWLHAWPEGHKQIWFERDGDSFKFGDKLKGENKVIEEVTRANSLFVSAAAQLKHEMIQPVYRWFHSLGEANNVRRARGPAYRRFPPVDLLLQKNRLPLGNEEGPDPTAGLLSLLRNADVGIVDIRVAELDNESMKRDSRRLDQRLEWTPWARIELRHACDLEDEGWLPLEEESHGTQTLFRLASPLLMTLSRGGILLIDELEASLHPALAQAIVRQFNDPETNPYNAQLIFTTHDTNLLGTTTGEPALRRDQVWFTEKDPKGATALYPLTDYKPRKAENLERGYLQGRYGAIPFLGDFSVLGE